MKKPLQKTLLLILAVIPLLTGCAGFKEKYQAQWWTPESFNYTLQRDRKTGEQSDYFGLSWSLKP